MGSIMTSIDRHIPYNNTQSLVCALHDDTLVFLLEASRELVCAHDRPSAAGLAVQVNNEHPGVVLVQLRDKSVPEETRDQHSCFAFNGSGVIPSLLLHELLDGRLDFRDMVRRVQALA